MADMVIFGVLFFVIGLCIGSFLNVVALRALTGESIVLPPSKCPKCGERIKPWDNIPVLSYLILRGKCRSCKEPISIQYPIVEFITGLGFLILFVQFRNLFLHSMQWKPIIILPFMLVIFSLCIAISITDIKEKVVFDVHTISLLVVILLFKFLEGVFAQTIIGLLLGIVIMESLSGISWIFTKKRAFGLGDTYITASMGALLGPKLFVIALVTAILVQVICTTPLFIKNLMDKKEYKLCIALGIFVPLFIIEKILLFKGVNEIINCILVLIIVIVGFYACKLLLTLKSLRENPTYFPFGPSLLFAMFLVILWGDVIEKVLLSLIS